MKIEAFGRIHIVYTPATSRDSAEFARTKNGRLLTENEVIAETNRNPELTRALRAHGIYFWLGRNGIHFSKHQRIDNKNNTFITVSKNDWSKLPFNERGYIHGGDGPLFMLVYDPYVSDVRLYIFAETSNTYTAPVIVYMAAGPAGLAVQKNDPSGADSTSADGKQPANGETIDLLKTVKIVEVWRKFAGFLMKIIRHK
jgi:hypothetical protein